MLYGTSEALPFLRIVRAGSFSALLDGGNLRYIRCGDVELLRAISFIVRDTTWGTYTPFIEDLDIHETERACQISYRGTCGGPEGKFFYDAEISIDATGHIVFAAEGEALSDFPTNRTGFVVLHPIEEVAGIPVEVEHTDGRIERTHFPDLIEPWQPIFDIRALTHEPRKGLRVTCRMEGDAFEMEDHRNWGDASYKTYVRPLSRGYPYVIPSHERIEQRVGVIAAGEFEQGEIDPRCTAPVHVTVGAFSGVMPEIALALDASDARNVLAVANTVREVRMQRLLVRFDPARHGEAELARIEEIRHTLGTAVTLEITIPGRDPGGELAAVASAVKRSGLNLPEIIVSPLRDLRSRPTGTPQDEAPLAEIAAAARMAFPAARIGGGSFAYFTELNRNPPDADDFDFITHSFAANIHSADDISVMETLETIPHMARTFRAMGGSKPHHIGFAAIGMREAPYGDGPVPNPEQRRVAASRFDPRQRGVFGASWALAFAARAAKEGIASVCLGMPIGPFGLMPGPDAGAAGQVYPIFSAVRGLARAAGHMRREVSISQPASVQAIASVAGGALELWLANLTAKRIEVAIEGFLPVSMRLLDTDTYAQAIASPNGFDETECSCAGTHVMLGAYAVACVAGKPST